MLSNLCHQMPPVLGQFIHMLQTQTVCNELPRQTINANAPSDELGYRTLSGVEQNHISYCVSHLALEQWGPHPRQLEDVPDEFPRKEIFVTHHHCCFQAGCQILGGLVPTGPA